MSPLNQGILIIGGGISGLALALSLHQEGIHVTVFEHQPQTHNASGSMVLTPNALRVLDHLGVYKAVATEGSQHHGVSFVNTRGTPLANMILGSEELGAVRIHRSAVRRHLLTKAIEQGIEIHFSARCIQVIDDNEDHVTVAFDNGETIQAGLVIGADGIFSTLRAHIDPDATAVYSGQTAVYAFSPTAEVDTTSWTGPVGIFGEEGSFFILPTDAKNSQFLIFSTVELPDRTKEEWRALESDTAGLVDILRRFDLEKWPQLVRDIIKVAPQDSYGLWPFRYISHLSRYSSKTGRVILIGDSAHAVPPSAGQGGAMALEDAETLAYTLAASLEELQDVSLTYLLQKWEKHRMQRIEKVAELTRNRSLVRKAAPGRAAQEAKEEQMKEASKSEPALSWLYGYSVDEFHAVLRSD